MILPTFRTFGRWFDARNAGSFRIFALCVLFAGVVSAGRAEARAGKVLLIALDGATWDVIHPMIEAGKLPAFARLVREGSSGPLISITEPRWYHSAALWTTVATGKHPQEHGIIDAVVDGQNVTSNMRRAKAVWNIAGEYGRTAGVVGYYVTWPVEPIGGFMVSDRAWAKRLDRLVHPPDLSGAPTGDRFWAWPPTSPENTRKMRRFVKFDFDPSYKQWPRGKPLQWDNFLVDQRLNWVYPRDESYARIGLGLLKTHSPDLFITYFRGIDFVSHGFWMYHQPSWTGYSDACRRFLDPAGIGRFGDVIRQYYAYMDEVVGRFMEAADERTRLFVLSDHGFGPDARRSDSEYWYLTGNHRRDGILAVWGRGVRKRATARNASLLDVAPTVLHSLGLPVGKDMPGRVLTELFEESGPPARYVETHGGVRGARREKPIRSEVDEEIKERLRALGYLPE